MNCFSLVCRALSGGLLPAATCAPALSQLGISRVYGGINSGSNNSKNSFELFNGERRQFLFPDLAFNT